MSQQIVLADYKEHLKPYRHYRSRYYCPACDGHNLTFSPAGAWTCWNDESREHRVEIMARLVPDFKRSTPRQPEPVSSPVILPQIHPAQLGYPLITDEVLSKVSDERTIYRYSQFQRVMRIDRNGKKSIFPQFFNGSTWVNGAGSRAWAPYGLSRLLPYPSTTNLILVVEGQKCVEIAHHRGIPALCLQGGDYSNQTTFDKLRSIKTRLGRVLLVILPDNDLAGTNKANHIIHTARYFSLPTLLLDPLQLDSTLGEGDDIEQMPNLDRHLLLKVVKKKLSSRSIDK